MLDYAVVPPEINSGRLYAGPGSAPMMAAASAWRGLAGELTSALSSYEAVISELAGEEWMGPASASMSTAAKPYLSWMADAAANADQAASQATAAAAAFEAAHAATPHPAAIAANRAEHALLVATNVLGQNTAAILANEAVYLEMWAQAAGVMYGYAGSSATATQVTPFTEPRQTTNPAGISNQAAAVSQGSGTAVGNVAQTAQLISSLPSAVQGLSSPAAAAVSTTSGPQGWIGWLESLLNNNSLNGFAYLVGNPLYNFANTMGTGAAFIPSSLLPSLVGYLTGGGFSAAGGSGAIGSGLGAILGPGGALGALGGLGGGATSGIGSAFSAGAVSGAAPGVVTAGMGQASLVGSFSAPASWAAATPAGATLVAAQPSGWAVAPESHSMAAVPGGMPLGGAGRGSFGYGAPRYGVRLRVMPRPLVC